MQYSTSKVLGGMMALAVAGGASAASISLTSGIDPSTQTGATLIANGSGTYVVAANVGAQAAGTVTVDGTDFLAGALDSNNTSVTANGVTIAWATDMSGTGGGGGAENHAPTTTAYSTAGDANLGVLMGDLVFSGRTESGGDLSDIVVTISGLTDGQEYRVQLLSDQADVGAAFRDFVQVTDGTVSTGAFQVGDVGGASVIYTFTADNTGSASLTLDGNESGAFVRTVLSGVSVYEVPEPGSLALLGLGGLAMLRRRRM